MSLQELLYPFTVIIEWMRNNYIELAGFRFTFMNMFVWTSAATMVLGAIVSWFRGE